MSPLPFLARALAITWMATSVIAPLWIYADSRRRYEQGIGCLWTLVAVALGPLALLGYLVSRPAELDSEVKVEPPLSHKDCPSCAAENPWNAMFCGLCGVSLRTAVRKPALSGDRVTCISCGERVPGGCFCVRCGNSLGDGGSTP